MRLVVRSAARWLMLPIAAFAMAGCVLPARSTSAYAGKAADSAKGMASAVGTARFAAELASAGKSTAPATAVAMSNAESDANTAQATFDSIQPPNAAADRIRRHLDDLYTNAIDTITDLRISARRGELDALARQAAPLRRISAQLERFQQVYG
jgi:hypothetical protein